MCDAQSAVGSKTARVPRRLTTVRLRRCLITRVAAASGLGAVTTIAVSCITAVSAVGTIAGGASATGQHEGTVWITHFRVYRSTFKSVTEWSAWDVVRPGNTSGGNIALESLPYWSSALSWDHSIADQSWEIATGWPMRAMFSVLEDKPHNIPYGVSPFEARSGLQLEPRLTAHGPEPRVLPLRIIPLGFAVNTALAAVLWWLLLLAFPTTRRFLRHRRGACLKCGYGPLPSPDARCSECGWNRDGAQTA